MRFDRKSDSKKTFSIKSNWLWRDLPNKTICSISTVFSDEYSPDSPHFFNNFAHNWGWDSSPTTSRIGRVLQFGWSLKNLIIREGISSSKRIRTLSSLAWASPNKLFWTTEEMSRSVASPASASATDNVSTCAPGTTSRLSRPSTSALRNTRAADIRRPSGPTDTGSMPDPSGRAGCSATPTSWAAAMKAATPESVLAMPHLASPICISRSSSPKHFAACAAPHSGSSRCFAQASKSAAVPRTQSIPLTADEPPRTRPRGNRRARPSSPGTGAVWNIQS